MATNDDSAAVELRGPCPREVVDGLDAFSNARRMTRTELVNRILSKWASDRLHEMNVLQNITRGNPPLRDTGHGDLE
jgi:hypothetical protein